MNHQLTTEDRRKGAEVVNRRRMAAKVEEARAVEIVRRLVSESEDVAPAALSAALRLIEKVESAAADMEIDDPLSLQRMANAAEIIHRVSRLASGQSTSNTAHAVLTDEERRERMARIRGDVNVGTPVPDPPRSDA